MDHFTHPSRDEAMDKDPKGTAPGTGSASFHLRMAESYAAAGNHALAAAHFRLAGTLLARANRITASNRAWSEYRTHTRTLQQQRALVPANAKTTEKG